MALEERLQRLARDQHTSLAFLRKRVLFERFLARLSDVAPGRWVLKGALALDFRSGHGSRTSLDMDLARYDDERQATEDMLAAASLDLGDFLIYRVERVALRENAPTVNVRYRVEADLAGRTFDAVLVDIGLSDPLLSKPDHSVTPGSLEFAGINAVSIPVLPLEQQVAEKLHAYTRTYAGERRSSRVKDLVDLHFIATRFSLDTSRLEEAVRAVFAHRSTHEVPKSLPQPPADWEKAFARLQDQVGRVEGLEIAYRKVVDLLDPILQGQAADRWSPAEGKWVSG